MLHIGYNNLQYDVHKYYYLLQLLAPQALPVSLLLHNYYSSTVTKSSSGSFFKRKTKFETPKALPSHYSTECSEMRSIFLLKKMLFSYK